MTETETETTRARMRTNKETGRFDRTKSGLLIVIPMGISLDEADRGEADVVTTRGGGERGKPPGLSDILSRGSLVFFTGEGD